MVPTRSMDRSNEAMLVALRSVVAVDPALLLRALEVYEFDRIDFAEAYLAACAESSGANRERLQDVDRLGDDEIGDEQLWFGCQVGRGS